MTHHLSETQIIERNRENQGLNAYGLMSNLLPTATTLGAMYGVNYLINRGLNNGGHKTTHGVREAILEPAPHHKRQEALSGENSHYEASPPPHLGGDEATLTSLSAQIVDNLGSRVYGNLRDIDANSGEVFGLGELTGLRQRK